MATVKKKRGRTTTGAAKERTRVDSTDLPRRNVETAIETIRPLHETFASKPTS
jgi:hypothetical protein